MKSVLLLFLLLFSTLAFSQTILKGSEFIVNNTTFLSGTFDSMVDNHMTKWTVTGTGFFFDFFLPSGDTVPTIVTNAHVLRDMDTCTFTFNSSLGQGVRYGKIVGLKIVVKQYKGIIYHPTEDLAIILISPIVGQIFRENHVNVVYSPYDANHILLDTNERKMEAIENILMTGYPNGYYDYKNYLPVVRRGITASPYFLDFQGRKQFLIDIADFSGSSGSPVVYYDEGRLVPGGIRSGSSLYLLGINTESISRRADGVGLNLGVCIKASQLLDFIPFIKQKVNSSKEFY